MGGGSHAPVISRMRKNAPFGDKNSKIFLWIGHSPLSRPLPVGEAGTPSPTPTTLPTNLGSALSDRYVLRFYSAPPHRGRGYSNISVSVYMYYARVEIST